MFVPVSEAIQQGWLAMQNLDYDPNNIYSWNQMRQKLKKLSVAYIALLLVASLNLGLVAAPATYAAPAPENTSKGDPAASSGNCSTISKCDLINNYVTPMIKFLAAVVGLAVVVSIVIGGIQYGQSAGDPSKVTAAKNRIRNAIIALLTFLFLYALLNFLIPGGLF
jgi:hypothetical protein